MLFTVKANLLLSTYWLTYRAPTQGVKPWSGNIRNRNIGSIWGLDRVFRWKNPWDKLILCGFLFNPNWNGWYQSWPRQLWPQIAGKLIKYLFLVLNTYSCRNVFRVFLIFWCDFKKRCFEYILTYFHQKSGTHGWEKSRQAVVRSPVRRQSGFQSVSNPGPCKAQGVAGS
jgi:hypothetical protein